MKWFIPILILSIVLIAGCTQTIQPIACTAEAKICPDGSAVGRVAPNCDFAPCPQTNQTQGQENQTTSLCGSNCSGSAGQCKEHHCVDGKCTIITLSNCCGNGICEPNEMNDLYTNCLADCRTIVQEINHTSCVESGKIKVLVLGLAGINPPFTQDTLNALNESMVGYPVELTVKRFEDLGIATNDSLSKEYSINGFPSVIINCHLYFTGKRTVDNFKTIFGDLLETENKP